VPYGDDDLRYIYGKTGGYCYYCHKKLAFTNYGRRGEKGAWHVDHANPRAKGGSDYFRNLEPACIDCNQEKSDRTAQSYKRSLNPPKKEGCFITTAAFNSPMASEVEALRRFRDTVLWPTLLGRGMVMAYYDVSPPAADIVATSPGLSRFVRASVRRLLTLVNASPRKMDPNGTEAQPFRGVFLLVAVETSTMIVLTTLGLSKLVSFRRREIS